MYRTSQRRVEHRRRHKEQECALNKRKRGRRDCHESVGPEPRPVRRKDQDHAARRRGGTSLGGRPGEDTHTHTLTGEGSRGQHLGFSVCLFALHRRHVGEEAKDGVADLMGLWRTRGLEQDTTGLRTEEETAEAQCIYASGF